MKKYLLFLLLVFPLLAHSQTSKVLVCAPRDSNAAKTTRTSLEKVYHDPIDISDTLTDAINSYQAVFLVLSKRPFTVAEELLRKPYLRSNHKLYVEYGASKLINDLKDSNEFWKFVGIDRALTDEVFSRIQDVFGVDSTFTEGMKVHNSQYNPLEYPYSGGWGLAGKIALVLTSTPDGIQLAHTYETDSFKVVLHMPDIRDYYDEFIGRVICNYFDMCVLGTQPVLSHGEPTFSIFPNPASDEISISATGASSALQSIEILSPLGNTIAKYSAVESSIGGGSYKIKLNSSLFSSGAYFVRLQTAGESVIKPLLIYSK